jgi:hypothetical protein
MCNSDLKDGGNLKIASIQSENVFNEARNRTKSVHMPRRENVNFTSQYDQVIQEKHELEEGNQHDRQSQSVASMMSQKMDSMAAMIVKMNLKVESLQSEIKELKAEQSARASN